MKNIYKYLVIKLLKYLQEKPDKITSTFWPELFQLYHCFCCPCPISTRLDEGDVSPPTECAELKYSSLLSDYLYY